MLTPSANFKKLLMLSLATVAFFVAHLLVISNAWGNVYGDQDLRFKHFLTGEQDLVTQNINAVTSICQDRLGYLWFSGEGGVARFNGIEFEFFKKDLKQDHSLSSSYAWDLAVDRDGMLWVATAQGLNRYDERINGFRQYTQHQPGPGIRPSAALNVQTVYTLAVADDNQLFIGSSSGLFVLNPQRTAFSRLNAFGAQAIRELFNDGQGNIWVGTSDQGVFRYTPSNGEIKNWRHDAQDPTSLPYNYVRAIERDAQGRIWVGTFGGGVARLHSDGQGFDRFVHRAGVAHSLGSDSIWDIHRDAEGNLWFATDPGGLSLFNPEEEHFYRIRRDPYQPQSLISDKVRSVFDDHNGDLWVGTFPSGINYLNKSTARFRNYTANGPAEFALSHEIVTRFFEDSKRRIWVGTEGGLNQFHSREGRFTHYRAEEDNANALHANAVLAIAEDDQQHLWVGTWSGGLHRMDPDSGRFTHYGRDESSAHRIHDDYIWSLLYDSQQRLWVGTENAGLLMKPSTDAPFVQFNSDEQDPESLSFRHVWALLEDSQQRLWVGTIDGLDRLIDVEGDRARFAHYRHDPHDEESLSSNRIISLLEDRHGQLWVGTQDAGLNRLDPHSGDVMRIGVNEGLPSNHISSLLEDEQGFIWMSTVNGIAMLNPATLAVRSYGESNGLVSNHFNRDAAYKDAQGQLYFGGAKGFSVFDPSNFNEPIAAPRVLLSDFRLFNRSITPQQPDSPLTEPITSAKAVTLTHRHSMFAFDFFAVSFRAAHRNQYAYKLDGFDQSWNYVGNQNSATYTNLDPGRYVFKVKAANAAGVWNNDGAAIEVRIKAPFYLTPAAYAAYVGLLLALALLALNVHRKKLFYLNQKVIAEKLVKLDRLKDAFLANTSHELRTPLNGIIGLAEQLRDGAKGELADEVKYTLNVISSCGRRLASLINDILDYAKLTEQQLLLKSAPTQVHGIVKNVFELLAPLVGQKTLAMINDVPEALYVDADEDRLHQILLNLVGNAVKFSESGHVRVYSRTDGRQALLAVEDTGPGIDSDDISKIFSAFIQLDDDETREKGGTGLGLAITKQLVELHGSEILVDSTPGKGTTFKFFMTVSDANQVRAKKADKTVQQTIDDVERKTLNSIVERGDSANLNLLKPALADNAYTILVVDDDAVNRMVLSSILAIQNYQVLEAANGQEALELLEQHPQVDLVILDVMMPKMSGYEVCMRIRTKYPVQTMPIIFLTAKHFSDDLVRGFISGGSDFLTKPVSKHELLSRLSTHLSLLNIHRTLEDNYQRVVAEKLSSDREAKTLEHIVDIINREMDFKQILGQLLVDIKELLRADEIIYWQTDQKDRTHYAVITNVKEGFKEVCLLGGDDIISELKRLFKAGQSVLILEDSAFAELAFVKQSFPDSHSTILMTIYFEDEVIGFITAQSAHSGLTFDQHTIAVLERIHAHVTSALVKAQLLQQAGIDSWLDAH